MLESKASEINYISYPSKIFNTYLLYETLEISSILEDLSSLEKDLVIKNYEKRLKYRRHNKEDNLLKQTLKMISKRYF